VAIVIVLPIARRRQEEQWKELSTGFALARLIELRVQLELEVRVADILLISRR
jgi:hypothetical protein